MLRARDGLGTGLAGGGRYIPQPIARSLYIDKAARAEAQRALRRMAEGPQDVDKVNILPERLEGLQDKEANLQTRELTYR